MTKHGRRAAALVQRSPNLEMTDNYNSSLLRLARRLAPEVTRKFLQDKHAYAFGLDRPAEVAPR
jgi:hypothetical protein